MNTPTLLWVDLRVDLRHDKSEPFFHADLADLCSVHPLSSDTELIKNIEATYPDIICFEYDFPSINRLQSLQLAKHTFPSIPILMITEHHSEALAIWALRARVWDYLVKPIESDDLCRRIATLSAIRPKADTGRQRDMVLPGQADILVDRVRTPESRKRSVSRAVDYFEQHYQEKISISLLAQLCNMSPSQFTRAFRREYGITVRDYLVAYRIDRACELLSGSNLPVGDIAFASGFADHSYFSRMFRRQTGLAPSDYRLSKFQTRK